MSKPGVKFSEVKELLIKDDTFKEEYEKLKLGEELLAVEKDRLTGLMGCTPEELDSYLDGIVDGVEPKRISRKVREGDES
jgi:hypothetical protein